MPRRRPGELIPIEVEILLQALQLASAGQVEFYGFGIASELRDAGTSSALIGHGTLYKALARLETGGMLESRLEDPDLAAEAGRPRRRLYRVTTQGRHTATSALASRRSGETGWLPGIEPA
jgi:DNA-binding PadR family transcriptional regulator